MGQILVYASRCTVGVMERADVKRLVVQTTGGARSNNNSWHRKMTNPTNLAIPPY